MKCIFCGHALRRESCYDSNIEAWACRDCKVPKYSTVYRQLYYVDQNDMLHDLIKIDDWCITRWYKSRIIPLEFSLIYKDVIGVMRGVVGYNGTDPEPISINPPSVRINGIVKIDTTNLESIKHKLSTWITFS